MRVLTCGGVGVAPLSMAQLQGAMAAYALFWLGGIFVLKRRVVDDCG